MTQEAAVAQESRTERLTITVTPSEKDAIEMVAKVRRPEGGVSGLIRERSFSEVVEEGRRLLEHLDRLAEEGAA